MYLVAGIEIKYNTVLLKIQKSYNIGTKAFYLLISGVLIAYYIYILLPDIEEPWTIMLFNAGLKTASHSVSEDMD